MKIMKLGFLALSLIAPIVAQEKPVEEPNGFLAAQANAIDFATGMFNGALTTLIAGTAMEYFLSAGNPEHSPFHHIYTGHNYYGNFQKYLDKIPVFAAFIAPIAIVGSATSSYLSSFIIKSAAKLVGSNRTDINNGKISTAHKAGVATGVAAVSLFGTVSLLRAAQVLTK